MYFIKFSDKVLKFGIWLVGSTNQDFGHICYTSKIKNPWRLISLVTSDLLKQPNNLHEVI